MIVGIVGSRDYNDYSNFVNILNDHLLETNQIVTKIISGGANGVDSLAKRYAIENKIQYEEFAANWQKYGKSAGPIRNTLIVENIDELIAFPLYNGRSVGTNDTINKAKTRGLKVNIFYI
jgi:hypothetical protein